MLCVSSFAQENDLQIGIQYYNQHNYKRAFHHFVRAQIQGINEAHNYLGICYENGYGVNVSIPKAIECYEFGIKKGDAYAMVNLGCLYAKGIGNTKDEKKAFSLFKKSAEKGCNYGQRMLAYSYYYGIGTPKNGDLAVYWMTKAKDNDDELAAKVLKDMKYTVEYEKEHLNQQNVGEKKPTIVTIVMNKKNQVFYVPCKINGQKADFIFDTGAGMISLSADFTDKLLKQGLISQSDVIGQTNSMVADGRTQAVTIVKIKDVEIGGLHLNDVNAVIRKQQNAPLLLGLSAIEKLGKVTISGNQLIIFRN